MCGIAGFSLKQNANKKAALNKLKILGLYNIERGKDASGVFINNEIIKDSVLFNQLIENNALESTVNNNIAMLHARQGSFGYKKTIDQAHPFLVNYNMVFTHNGTITNIKELCTKYKIKFEDYNVDSEAFAALLDQNGTAVLEKYEGAAAIAYTFLDQENTLMLYHGASKNTYYVASAEERPLFILEDKDGIYYSSLKNSLEAIKEDKNAKIYCLEHNYLITIKNGKIIEKETTHINRDAINSKPPTVYNPPTKYSRSIPFSKEENIIISRESLPNKVTENNCVNRVYFHNNRYWFFPRILAHGNHNLDKKGFISDYNNINTKTFCFVEGVLIKDKQFFKTIIEELIKLKKDNHIIYLSKFSTHPITKIEIKDNQITDDSINFGSELFYLNGQTTGSLKFTPKFSSRNYELKQGKLINIVSSEKETKLIHEYKYSADKDVQKLINSNLDLNEDSGGNLKEFSFPKEEKFFWEVAFTSKKEAYEVISTKEYECLKEFTRYEYLNNFLLDASEEEIITATDELIEDCIKNKTSIESTLGFNYGFIQAVEEIERLKSFYLEEKNNQDLEIKETLLEDKLFQIINIIEDLGSENSDFYLEINSVKNTVLKEKYMRIHDLLDSNIDIILEDFGELSDEKIKKTILKVNNKKKEYYGIL